ncbi:oligopeptide ABC transporter permease [Actinomadura rubrisoli]|uniref:ABC transporter permease n=1 Tax=Actinomadura rubrisoli TaxID=2530368 RepID=A0A4R5CGN1_9ACTN|nr:oligopeptide ABC transporter permease [Actinomadura rubrisoli]TDD96424.1 ABC transporter permease [Actinomadura rubrisoli]
MTTLVTDAAPAARRRSPAARTLRRFLRNRLAVAGAVMLIVAIVLSACAPLIARYEPNAVDLGAFRQPPSAEHWLGTDSSGRDVFARLAHAGRVSLAVGLLASVAAVLAGLVLGAIAGTIGGLLDALIMRIADIVLSFPALIVIIVLAGILGPSVPMLVIVFAACNWPTACRVVRGLALSLREQEYVQAARSAGADTGWIIRRHIVPAVLGQVAVVGTLLVAQTILLEAVLSFLGLGVQPPQASWGNMLTDAQNLTLIRTMPWLWVPPGLAIALTVLAVNFVGDGLRDAVDPKQNRGAGR